jgi:hypothetical protein
METAMKSSKHLGQSLSMGLLLFVSSIGIVGLMAFQSGAFK